MHTAIRAHQSNTDVSNTASFKRLAGLVHLLLITLCGCILTLLVPVTLCLIYIATLCYSSSIWTSCPYLSEICFSCLPHYVLNSQWSHYISWLTFIFCLTGLFCRCLFHIRPGLSKASKEPLSGLLKQVLFTGWMLFLSPNQQLSKHLMASLQLSHLLCPPPPYGGGITRWCVSDICLSDTVQWYYTIHCMNRMQHLLWLLLSKHNVAIYQLLSLMLWVLKASRDFWLLVEWVLVCWCWQFDWSFARLIAPVATTTSTTLSSNKIQNGDILIPSNPGSPGKWLLKWRERESWIVMINAAEWQYFIFPNTSLCSL